MASPRLHWSQVEEIVRPSRYLVVLGETRTIHLNTFRGLGKTAHQRRWDTHILWSKYLLLVCLARLRKTGMCRQIWKTQQARQFLPTIQSPGLEDTRLRIEFTYSTSQPWHTCFTAHWRPHPTPEVHSLLVCSWVRLCFLDIKCKADVFTAIDTFWSDDSNPSVGPLLQSSCYLWPCKWCASLL